MKVRLVSIDADKVVEQIAVETLPAVIGRSLKADATIDHLCVSRFHCILEDVGGKIVVRDLGSTNGTRLNDEAITTAPLRTGDHLAIGGFTFLVLVRSEEWDLPSTIVLAPGLG